MKIFRSAQYVSDDSILKSHELVTLHDPETKSSTTITSIVHDEDEDASTPCSVSRDKVDEEGSIGGTVNSMEHEINKAFSPGRVLIEPEGLIRTTTSLWVLETESGALDVTSYSTATSNFTFLSSE